MPERGENNASFAHLIEVIMKALRTNSLEAVEMPPSDAPEGREKEIKIEEEIIIIEEEVTNEKIEELKEKFQEERREKERLARLVNKKQEKRKIKVHTIAETKKEIQQMIVGLAIGIVSVVAGTLYYLQKN